MVSSASFFLFGCLLCGFAPTTESFSLPTANNAVKAPQESSSSSTTTPKSMEQAARHLAVGAALVAATSGAFASPVMADTGSSAQIQLNSLPPTSIRVQIQDLPVVGKLLSGTYSKVPDGSLNLGKNKEASVVIKSPTDKVKAVQSVVTNGHLEFDVSGILNTHVDIDIAAEQAGVLRARVASSLIPKLPFTNNAASASATSPTGGRESAWNMVTNMGSGETYYYNEKTGATQYMRPDKL